MCESARWRDLIAGALLRLERVGDTAKLDAEVLGAHVSGRTRAHFLAHLDDTASEDEASRFLGLVERRSSGEPMAYILGYREFFGREFLVTPATLIPRPETELVVERFIELERFLPPGPVADVGTGCGCILVSVSLRCRRFAVGTDISAKALEICQANASVASLRDRVGIVRTDLLRAFRPASLAAVLANLPYVAQGDPLLSPEVAAWEPAVALYGGTDGLSLLRTLIAQAREVLMKGAAIVLEVGAGQAAAVLDLLAGYHDVETRCDLAGIPRVVSAFR